MRDQRATASATDRFRKGDRLPPVRLRERAGEVEVSLRRSRGPRVLVTLHQQDCDECIDYVKSLASERERLESWGAEMVVISTGSLSDGGSVLAGLGVPVLEDPTHVVADGRLTVLIADEWGEVYFASEPTETHGPIAPEEVVEWVKFVSIQCPECEGPEGEWRNL